MRIEELIKLFRGAGFQGKVFASSSDALVSEYVKDTRSIKCPVRDERIHFEACKWHRETKDPLCEKCRLKFG